MVLIFDLDDTLYPEHTFVESGFHAVAEMLEAAYGWERQQSFLEMIYILRAKGRGAVFDTFLRTKQRCTLGLVRKCVQTYRSHEPKLSLYPEAKQFLDANKPIYIVTDGHKIVQASKVKALGLHSYCKKIFITHRYGKHHAKPSLYCFERIRAREQCEWSEMMYVGDNPSKDFINLNLVGAHTVRVHTGEHRDVAATPAYDAKFHINSIEEISHIIKNIENNTELFHGK